MKVKENTPIITDSIDEFLRSVKRTKLKKSPETMSRNTSLLEASDIGTSTSDEKENKQIHNNVELKPDMI